MRRLTLLLALLVSPVAVPAQDASSSWSGNMVKNPGFEEDFVNTYGEGHVLSFKGDWFYNQQDLIPDCWTLKGTHAWNDQGPKSGRRSLKLAAADSTAQQ